MAVKYFCFEGPDYSGKSSLMDEVGNQIKLNNPDIPLVLTREPGSSLSLFCSKVRDILQHIEIKDELSYSVLFDVDRRIHLKDVVTPNISSGNTVLSDRCIISSICYQQEKVDELRSKNLAEFLSLNPYTFFIKANTDTILERIGYSEMTMFERKIFTERIDYILKQYDVCALNFNGMIVDNNTGSDFDLNVDLIYSTIINLTKES
jgi:thymidylate kinase